MQFIYYAFVSFLLRNPLGVATNSLVTTNIENDALDSTPVSLFPDHEARSNGKMDDVDLFAPSAGATDPSIILPDMSSLDDPCPIGVSLEDNEGGSFELSDSDALWMRGLEDEDLGPLVESNDLQCRRRGTKPKKPEKDEVVPQEPSLWPLVYPELPNGQCPDLTRPVATCCTGRDGLNPFDCWPCMSCFVN